MEMSLLEFFAPVIVAVLTVPTYSIIKKYRNWTKGWRPIYQRAGAMTTAALLTQLGVLMNTVLPTVEMFTEGAAQTLLAGTMALAIHAGDKAKENAEATAT